MYPGIYYSVIYLDLSVSISCSIQFTFLYSHKQHAYLTSVKLLVNIRCLKKWISFIGAISAPSFDKNNHCTTHTASRRAIIIQAEIRIIYYNNSTKKEKKITPTFLSNIFQNYHKMYKNNQRTKHNTFL